MQTLHVLWQLGAKRFLQITGVTQSTDGFGFFVSTRLEFTQLLDGKVGCLLVARNAGELQLGLQLRTTVGSAADNTGTRLVLREHRLLQSLRRVHHAFLRLGLRRFFNGLHRKRLRFYIGQHRFFFGNGGWLHWSDGCFRRTLCAWCCRLFRRFFLNNGTGWGCSLRYRCGGGRVLSAAHAGQLCLRGFDLFYELGDFGGVAARTGHAAQLLRHLGDVGHQRAGLL